MRIYLDTDLWNALCDQKIEPESLLRDLDTHGATVALGMHVIFELLKNFTSGNTARGRQLFTHLNSFLKAGVRCVAKDLSEILVAEMYALKGPEGAEKFLNVEDVFKVMGEIERLASGSVKPEWEVHIAEQSDFSERDRAAVRNSLSLRPTHLAFFRSITNEQVSAWLQRSANTTVGQELLLKNLQRRFPEESRSELHQYATAMLRAGSRVANAMVRADLYYTWRCAHRGSNPPDLLADIYHVLSASYCDVYASGERKQVQYASLLLKDDVRVSIYPRDTDVSRWLCAIAT
jgi:hypothetical protein